MDKDKHLQFTNLMAEHQRIIFKICNSYCRQAADREDLAQDMVFQLWKAFPNYQPDHKFSTWLYRVALNVAISHYRKHKNQPFTSNLDENMAKAVESPLYDQEKEQQIKTLEYFIKELPELDRALTILYLEEKTHQEISEILGISASNVGTKIGRIKEQLKQKFSKIKD